MHLFRRQDPLSYDERFVHFLIVDYGEFLRRRFEFAGD